MKIYIIQSFYFTKRIIYGFDIKAAGWDQNPLIWYRAEAIANEIKRLIPLKKQMTALEFGAGTGVTSFILKDYFNDLWIFKSSKRMVPRQCYDANIVISRLYLPC